MYTRTELWHTEWKWLVVIFEHLRGIRPEIKGLEKTLNQIRNQQVSVQIRAPAPVISGSPLLLLAALLHCQSRQVNRNWPA